MRIFTHPGLFNSGPDHWQTAWERNYGYTRIQQRDWERPVCAEWMATIDQQTENDREQVVLIGHSLACNTIVRWAEKYRRPVRAALLVAPSDVDAPSYPEGTTGFTPMPLYHLPFPSMIIASTNDEYVTAERARYFAEAWGSSIHFAGALGHINSSSNLGAWPEGHAWLQKLLTHL